jgi:hypothetical protein
MFNLLLRQVWQGYWKVVDWITGDVVFRSWSEEKTRQVFGGGYWDRTSDPSRVKRMLSR